MKQARNVGKSQSIDAEQRPSSANRLPVTTDDNDANAASSLAPVKTETGSVAKEHLERATNSTTNEPDIVWTDDDFADAFKKAERTGPRKMSDTDLLTFLHGASGYCFVRSCIELKPFFVELWRRIEKGMLKMSKTEACRQIGCSPQWVNSIISGRADKRRKEREQAKEEAKTRNLVSGNKLESSSAESSRAESSDDQDNSEDWGDEDWGDDQDDRTDESAREEKKDEAGPGLFSARTLALGGPAWSGEQDDRNDERREKSDDAKGAKADSVSGSDDEHAGLLTREEYTHKIWKSAFAILKPVMQRDWQLYRDVCADLSQQFAEASKAPTVAKALTAGAS